ncbi:hypothetical protein QSH18_04905 [Xanthomonas sp. NCPPB 2654]|uniref:hypothetical protein n=1 Tax=unclassified Xanthomonas TaxID=2643310 RepID=UPI0021DFE773|nr:MULTISPECIES: hypothetical protein [unclassified Xanthomonas]MDL5364935.1 hypothetical protein [Xanthomonas sp. NCPPB 2654]UYC19406.1 hypothetical protein NUG20_14600 [Xanthomonas sp. CFBP 8443]
MKTIPFKLPLCLSAVMAVIFVALHLDSLWNGSVDLAHHYALAYRISEQWFPLAANDPTLGEMNLYPKGAHIVAALLGRLLGSVFLGVHMTTLIALATIWLSLAALLHALPERRGPFALIAMGSLVALNAATVNLDLHGHEIIDNFFYSQLVGEALLYAGAVAAMLFERRFGTLQTCFALTLLMLVLASIHLLPAVAMLGLILGLLGIQVVRAIVSKSVSVRTLAPAAAMAAASIIGLVLHPSFSAVSSIAENNGRLEMVTVSYPVGVIALATLLVLTSIATFARWVRSARDDEYSLKYLALLGLAIGLLCLTQYAFNLRGSGSDYAVKKYIFCILSLLLIQLSALFGWLLSYPLRNRDFLLGHGALISAIILPTSLFITLSGTVPKAPWFDVSDIMRSERQIISVADTQLPSPADHKENVVIGTNRNPAFNYMFSLAITHTKRDLAISDVLISNNIADFERYSYIVSLGSDPLFGSSGCDTYAHGPMSVVASQCIAARTIAARRCKQDFDFSLKGSIPRGMISGFDGAEESSRWTQGKNASFTCTNADGAPATTLKMEIAPFLHGKLASQRIEILLNGKLLHEARISGNTTGKYPIDIAIPSEMQKLEYRFEFHMPDATSPQELGLSADGRQLGFSFKSLSLR